MLTVMATATPKEGELSSFELAQKHFAEGRQLLEQELNNARQEKAAIEQMTKTLNEVHFASTIKLNVGGKIYKTTLDTLRKDPDSMLCAMFSGRFEIKADEDDGAYFIDRDGELFRYILNYLRNGQLILTDDRIKEELLEEAKFYQVQGVIEQLEGKTATSPGFLGSSLIVKNETHQSALQSWLPPNATFSLLYRSSTDGCTPADFHRCCDNKGRTLVLIKSEEYIFGGYTSQSWELHPEINWKAVPDSQSFLFTLVNPSGNKPIKINPKADAAIRCRSDAGPSFGNSGPHCDLSVWNPTYGGLGSRVNLGFGFTCPQNVNRNTYLAGVNPFPVSELAVFKVNL